ncbi:MAG: MBL fold metallo-hydrolase [Proteobacteria bacterium]|nr:MBL fold metallo-hydrolase [Pseudomonadota bacterium]
MKITHLASATELIEANGVKILTDPWLVDGAFYGTWCHYPPVDLSRINLHDIDYIYVSHIHPDHFDPATLAMLPNKVPVLMHRYERPFLRLNVERLGFDVIEVPHGEPFDLGHGVTIEVYGADNCDPAICGKMFGCVPDKPKGSLQLDSLCVVTDGIFTLVNTNDCPYEISSATLRTVKGRHPNIDFALIGYSSASLYPHCMADYDSEQMERGKSVARRRGLISGLQSLRTLKPRFFMPFAGTYVLGGAVAHRTKDMPIVELQDAAAYLAGDVEVVADGSSAVLLNCGESFDLVAERPSKPFTPVDASARLRYVFENLAGRTLPYEHESPPSLGQFIAMADRCFERFEHKRNEIILNEQHFLYLSLPEGKLLRIPANGESWSIETSLRDEPFTWLEIDFRLLMRAMRGPKFANWNNIEIGAHASLRRNPDVFNQQIHILLNSFHE